MADPAIVAVVATSSGKPGHLRNRPLLGGLLAALKVAPQSDVTLTGDPLEELFSETYGRFLVAVKDEAALAGVEHRIIGRVGGDALTLRLKGETVIITPEELEAALSSTTRQMRF